MGRGRGGHNPGPVPSPLPPTPAHPHRPIPCHRLSSAGLKQAECSSGHQQGTEGPHCSQGAPCLQLGDPAPVSSRSSRRLHNQECLSSPPCPGQAPLGSSVASTKAERRDLQGGRRLLAGRMCPRGNLGEEAPGPCAQRRAWRLLWRREKREEAVPGLGRRASAAAFLRVTRAESGAASPALHWFHPPGASGSS